ncbi:MAG: DUF1223 domain-containing protein [Pseudomonadota bacterium]
MSVLKSLFATCRFAMFLCLLASGPILAKDSVLLELYTRNQCENCRVAETLAAEMIKQDKSLQYITFHVAHDNLERKGNPFTSEFNNERWRNYTQRMGYTYDYTPLFVFSGISNIIGAEKQKAYEALKKAKVFIKKLNLNINARKVKNTMFVDFEYERALQSKFDVWLYSYERKKASKISYGSQKGRYQRGVNIVNGAWLLGAWDGQATSVELQLPDRLRGKLLLVIQETKQGSIIAHDFL